MSDQVDVDRGRLRQRFWRHASMFVMVVHTLIIPISILGVLALASFPLFWPVLWIYSIIIVLDTSPENGAPLMRFQIWCRRTWWWKAFAFYYPIRVHKTVDLMPSSPPVVERGFFSSIIPWSWADSPLIIVAWPFLLIWALVRRLALPPPKTIPPNSGKKYLFGISPHGIISMGGFCGLGTEGAGWSQLFPNVPVRILTLSSNFYFPFYRQYLLAAGVSSVSKRSCINLLNNNQNIGIVLGGARESLLAEPSRFDVILNSRKGFIKVALSTGASLVPVICFGENEIYEQFRFPKGSLGDRIPRLMVKYFGFTIPLFHARGMFSKTSGFMAYRRPIDVVIGNPIDVPLSPEPSQAQIDEYHDRYVREFKQLYADNVNKFTPGVELRIVE